MSHTSVIKIRAPTPSRSWKPSAQTPPRRLLPSGEAASASTSRQWEGKKLGTAERELRSEPWGPQPRRRTSGSNRSTTASSKLKELEKSGRKKGSDQSVSEGVVLKPGG